MQDCNANCIKCGELFDSFNHDTYDGIDGCYEPYVICEKCNNEFWEKWYKLPKVQKIGNKFLKTESHTDLIKEYHKEGYFRL